MDPAMAIEVAAMSRQRIMDEAIAKGDSEIQRFYCNSTIFITGGSGFLGKQLIEKLFRSCDIAKIFVLLRSKKGKGVKQRIEDMLADPVFEQVRKQNPDFEKKLVPIEGDAAEVRLGVSDDNWKTISNEVDIIFHAAATTRFDETIKVATLINVRGTREAIILGKACKNLRSFVHVSTAYTQALSSKVYQEVYEEFQPSPIQPETLISMAETMEVARLNNMTASLISDWPNTYTFCKAVAETLVRSESEGLPVAIVRPGIVICSYREPAPGWIDMSCMYGASGLLLGVGIGIMHIFLQDARTKLGFVPCDMVNNAIIAAGREASFSHGGSASKIYSVSSGVRNTVTFGDIRAILHRVKYVATSPKAVYYNYGMLITNKWLFILLTWIIHYIPAYIIDFVCRLLGKEQRFVKLYTKIYKMSLALCYFSLNSWQFDDKNLVNLHKSLTKTDKIIFNFDITSINWTECVTIWCIGIRKYIIKDGLKQTELGLKKQFWFRILHYCLSCIYFYMLWKILYFSFYILSGIVSLVY